MTPEITLRVSVLGLIVDADDVLLIHQMDPPEADRWDLPGGGLEPHESLMEGLAREIREETGVIAFRADAFLTIVEDFYPRPKGGVLHTLNLVYKCAVPARPACLHSDEPEVGPKGIQWLPIRGLSRESCTTRAWKALQAAGLAPDQQK